MKIKIKKGSVDEFFAMDIIEVISRVVTLEFVVAVTYARGTVDDDVAIFTDENEHGFMVVTTPSELTLTSA